MIASSNSTDTIIIVGITSGIGAELADHYRLLGKHVIGTSRSGIDGHALDVNDPESIARFRDQLTLMGTRWNLLIVSVGVLAPIGPFLTTNFAAWEAAFRANSIAQWQLLAQLHPLRGEDSTVVFFAGGRVNGVLENYSNYGVAKIALVKMVEYLAQEDPDTRYAIVGPGMVATKIHEQTLAAGARAGDNLDRTRAFLAAPDMREIGDVAQCIDWIRSRPGAEIGGRNVSVVHDPWGDRKGSEDLVRAFAADPDAYKLRRAQPQPAAFGESFVADLIAALPTVPGQLARSTPLYKALRDALRPAIGTLFSDSGTARRFGPFGEIAFPYVKMGAVDSLDLFGLDELIIFAFYWANRTRYRRVADIGANIGLHTLVLSRCGFDVRSYEPDPRHATLLDANLRRNCIQRVDVRRAAVSDRDGTAEFVRVLGNTTSSHIAGSKDPYGELEHFSVDVDDIRSVIAWADLIKMDAEGHETTLFCAVEPDAWQGCDVMAEIGTAANAKMIFEHFQGSAMQLFSQKIGWRRVETLGEMPESYREGSLFITSRPSMPW